MAWDDNIKPMCRITLEDGTIITINHSPSIPRKEKVSSDFPPTYFSKPRFTCMFCTEELLRTYVFCPSCGSSICWADEEESHG